MRGKVVSIGTGLLLASAAAFAAADYSADMTMRGNGQAMTGKTYMSGQRLRQELGPLVTIMRFDEHKSYVLMPEQKMYLEKSIEPEARVRAGYGEDGDIAGVPMGQEEFDGRLVDKVKRTYTDGNGSHTVYQWMDDGLPVKVESEDGKWSVEYRNIQRGSQPDQLFEIPAGYQTFQMPNMSELMGQIGNAQEQDQGQAQDQ